jgi:transcription elongation GreA/GreB family factor
MVALEAARSKVDRGGRSTEYELVGRSPRESQRHKVVLGSPTGKALLGARPADVVRVTLPNRRRRRVRVVT